ncbi:MAG: acetyl-CoA carboxylase biotin carboxyl carrier protein subunit [Pseudomonas oryzihabitans]
MDEQRIRQLMDLLSQSDLSELTLSEGGSTLTLRREGDSGSHAGPGGLAVSSGNVAPPPPAADAPQATGRDALPATGTEVAAPLYGVLHLTPSPQEPAFVSVGSRVARGEVLCLVEAMKMFTSVTAPCAGIVSTVLVESGQEVESGQAVMVLIPDGEE